MYVPTRYVDSDQDRVLQFMRSNSFAAVVSSGAASPVATHLPLSFSGPPERLVLRGHFAKANPHWQLIADSETLVIFTGPHAYITPKWYDRFESVPTWNYLSVHAYGQARLTAAGETRQGLLDLFEQNDATYREQWEALSDRYREGMLAGIVGFEVAVSRIEAAAKLSQNRTAAEQDRIASHLQSSDDQLERETGTEMKKRRAAVRDD